MLSLRVVVMFYLMPIDWLLKTDLKRPRSLLLSFTWYEGLLKFINNINKSKQFSINKLHYFTTTISFYFNIKSILLWFFWTKGVWTYSVFTLNISYVNIPVYLIDCHKLSQHYYSVLTFSAFWSPFGISIITVNLDFIFKAHGWVYAISSVQSGTYLLIQCLEALVFQHLPSS